MRIVSIEAGLTPADFKPHGSSLRPALPELPPVLDRTEAGDDAEVG